MSWTEHPATILVIDDSLSAREDVRRVLSRAGHTVLEAPDIASAWQLLDSVEVAIIDVNLPDGNGLEFTSALRRHPEYSRLAILQISALAVAPSQQAFGLDSGADAYLVLPVPPPVLVSTVAALLRIRRAEAALTDSNRFISEITALLPDVVYIFDVERRTATFVNDSTDRALGYSAAEVLAFGDGFMSDIVHPEDLTALGEHLQRVAFLADGVVSRFEYRLRHRDGSWRWFLSQDVVFARAEDGRTRQLLGLATDITDRKVADSALRDSERRFRAMSDESPMMMWLFDAQGRMVWVNQTHCDYFGVLREEMNEDRWRTLTHAADLEEATERLGAGLQERREVHIVARCRRRDGAWRWVESWGQPRFGSDGSFAGLLGTSVDVNDRIHAEEALRRSVTMNRYYSRLYEILQPSDTPEDVRARAAQALGEHLNVARVQYLGVDETGEYATVQAEYCHDVPSVAGRHRLDDFGSEVTSELRAGRAVVVDDVATDSRLDDAQRSAISSITGSFVLDPIVDSGRTVAALAVHHTSAHHWTVDQLAVVNATLHRTRIALERSRLEEHMRVRSARAEFAAKLLADLEVQPTPVACYEWLVDALTPGLADYATVEVPGSDQSLVAAAHRSAGGKAPLPSVVTPAVKAECATTPEVSKQLARRGPRSHMAVPLDLGAGTKGVLMVGLVDPERPAYNDEDLGFLADLARSVGNVLAASQLRRDEHNAAVRLQQALLPDSIIWHPDIVIEARYHAASDLLEVGGDWYDTFMWPCGRIGLMVGDVVGHDIESAAAMGRLRAATAALASHLGPDPAVLLDALDRFAQGVDGTSFATAVCVIVDPATGLLTYSSAGHPPVLVISPDATVTRLDGAQSPPLCATITPSRRSASITLEPGSLVVMYSDGLIERRRERLDHGIDRLERSAIGHLGDPIDEFTDQIVADMAKHSAPTDDVVVACFRYTPAFARFETNIPAQADQLALLRAAIRVWADDQRVDGTLLKDLLLGVGEAVSNAMDHGYRDDSDGVVAIDISNHRTHLVARIVDNGHWRQPGSHSLDRGRGTSIMKAVASHTELETNSNGTTVIMSFPQAIPARTHQP